jgi:hypothetical protein
MAADLVARRRNRMQAHVGKFQWAGLVAAAVVCLAVTPAAQAKGCLSGAAVGGVAGHVAGHHGVLGAAAGCAMGHHAAAKKEKTQKQDEAKRSTAPADAPASDAPAAAAK